MQISTVIDFDKQTVNEWPATIHPEQIYWKWETEGRTVETTLDRYTGQVVMSDAKTRKTISSGQCETAGARKF